MYLFDIAAKKEHNVTANPFTDSRGTITPDGKSVVFISDRDGGTPHLFSVPLDRQKEDPNDPLVKERLRKAATAKPAAPGSKEAGQGQQETPAPRR